MYAGYPAACLIYSAACAAEATRLCAGAVLPPRARGPGMVACAVEVGVGVDVALFGEEVRCRQVVEYNGCASDRVGPAERRAESGPRSAAGMAAPGMGFGGRRGSKHECQIAKNAHGDE